MKTEIVCGIITVVVKLTDDELKRIHEGDKLYRTKSFTAEGEAVEENSSITVHFIVSKKES